MKILHREDYRVLRRAKYPPITDQLDALVKLAHALEQQGIELPPETRQLVQECMNVKARFKKSGGQG